MNPVAPKFHQHLDLCAQCRNHPMDLCPIGAMLLNQEVAAMAPANFVPIKPGEREGKS